MFGSSSVETSSPFIAGGPILFAHSSKRACPERSRRGGIPRPSRPWGFSSFTTRLFHHIFLVPPSQTPNCNRARIHRQSSIENCARLQRRTQNPPQNHFRRLL